jgi:hypothetical protein
MKKNILLLSLLFSLFFTEALAADSGLFNKGIFLMNKSPDNVRMWFGHKRPSEIKGFLAADDHKIDYVNLKYVERDENLNLLINDTILVNAVINTDTEPYSTLVSKRFNVKGYIGDLSFTYTPGNITMELNEIRPMPSTNSVIENECEKRGLVDSGVKFSGLNGQIEVAPGKNLMAWSLAKMNTVLCVGDHVKTDEDSTAVLSFSDMSTFVMKPETELIIDAPPGKDNKIKLERGGIWANIKKIAEGGSMSIEMNQAVAGIKGTTLVCEQFPDGNSSLKVIEGEVLLTSKLTRESVSVGAGKKLVASLNDMGPIADFDVSSESSYWLGLTDGLSEEGDASDAWGYGIYALLLLIFVFLIIAPYGFFKFYLKR